MALDPSNPLSSLVGTQIDGKDIWSAYQTAQYIARYHITWVDTTDLNLTYDFVLGTTNGDYPLSETSVAEDAGIATPTVTTDINGAPHNDGALDVGIYEFNAGGNTSGNSRL